MKNIEKPPLPVVKKAPVRRVISKDDDDDPLDAFMKEISAPAPSTKTVAPIRRVIPRDDDDPLDALMKEVTPPGSSAPAEGKANKQQDDVDPLDAFMNDISATRAAEESAAKEDAVLKTKGVRADIEDEDDLEAYLQYVEDHKDDKEEEDFDEYDEDGNLIYKAKVFELLPFIDHTQVSYPAFERDFYTEHTEITALTGDQVVGLRRKLGITVSGGEVPKPCVSFAHFNFDDNTMALIRKLEYSAPTAIQTQAVPCALSGRDIIGIAKTGSGKTAAFLWPMITHIMDQPELVKGDGPIGIVLAPTRELCQQIHTEAKRFGKPYNLKVACVYGGGSKWEQTQELDHGCEILVATPGRLIDLLKSKATSLSRVTFLVLDEADRMFDMGFEPQVRCIVGQIRPDKQALLFSATFKKKVERLCRDILSDPIRIVIGEVGEANEDVRQEIEVFFDAPQKWNWINLKLVEFQSAGNVLIFVTKKQNAEELAANLKVKGFEVLLLHGDMDQNSRAQVLFDFKKQTIRILVATDVAARGLDIPSIRTVINYDVARDIDTHTHRIGRTGRAGVKGTAYTLLLETEVNFAVDLVRNLESANQVVPSRLMDVALKNPKFRQRRGSKVKDARARGSGRGQPRDYSAVPPPAAIRQLVRPGLGTGANSVMVSSNLVIPGPKMYGPRPPVLAPQSQSFGALQFRSKFQKASDTPVAPPTPPAQPTPPTPPPKLAVPVNPSFEKKRRRWDT